MRTLLSSSVALALALALAALSPFGASAHADPLDHWPSLDAQRALKGGLFTAWGVSQPSVLSAIRAVARTDPERDLRDRKQRADWDPTDLAAADALGLAYRRHGLVPEAVAQFRRALALDPAFLRSRLNLFDLLREAGSTDLAARELVEGIRLQPTALVLRRMLADLYVEVRRYKDAAAVLRELVAAAPGDAEAHLALARALLRAGEREDARAAAERAARLAPADPAPRFVMAEVYRAASNWSAAESELEDALRTHPQSDAARQLGLLHVAEGDYPAARQSFKQALALPNPDVTAFAGAAVAAQAKGDFDAVADLCRQMRRAGHERLAASIMANAWLARGDATGILAVWSALPTDQHAMSTAYDGFLEATREAPESAAELALQLSRTELFMEAGWPQQAASAVEAVVKLVPSSLAAAERLADCYAAAGDEAGEMRIRENLAQKHPDNSAVASRLARAWLARGNLARAEEVSRDFVKRYYDDLENRLIVGELALRRGDFKAAVADLRPAFARHPLDDRPYLLLLDSLVRSGELVEAAAVVRNRQGAVPTFVPGPLERAILAAAEDKPDEALACLRRGFPRAPLDAHLRVLAGTLLERQGNIAAATAQFQVAAWREPGHLSTHLLVARTAARAGLPEAALKAYRAALAIAPGAFDLALEAADAAAQLGLRSEALALLASARPKPGPQRRAIEARSAELFLLAGEPQRARDAAQAVLKQDPADPIARRVVLWACRELGDLEGALKLAEAWAKAAAAPELDADLGTLFLLHQRHREAEERLAAAAAAAEQRAQQFALAKLHAVACIATGLPKKALAALDAASDARTADIPLGDDLAIAYLAAGAAGKAEQIIQQIEKSRPTQAGWLKSALSPLAADRDLATLTLAGYAASATGWRAKAAELLRAALKRAPAEPLLLHAEASAQADAGQLDAAIASANELTRLCPAAGEAQLLLARILDKQGKSEAALDACARALPLLDKAAAAERLAIAERLAAAGRHQPAIEAYRLVLDAQPGHPIAASRLAALYAAHAPAKLAEAEDLAAAAAKARPHDPAIRDTLGWTLLLARKHAQARAELCAAIALAPPNGLYLYHLGMVDLALGRRDRARRALSMALALDPKLPEAETARSTLKLLENPQAPPPRKPDHPAK